MGIFQFARVGPNAWPKEAAATPEISLAPTVFIAVL